MYFYFIVAVQDRTITTIVLISLLEPSSRNRKEEQRLERVHDAARGASISVRLDP